MSDDELDWRKNVKPIKSKKVTLKVEHKVDIKHIVNKVTFSLQGDFLCANNVFSLDYNTKLKIDRGKYPLSDKLDLHGYNMKDAYCKLMDFIIKNYQAGNRCLLIITGQGNATGKTDTIKGNLSKWLSNTKIQHMVLYCQQATKKHGDKGAFYVLLRKNRDPRAAA